MDYHTMSLEKIDAGIEKVVARLRNGGSAGDVKHLENLRRMRRRRIEIEQKKHGVCVMPTSSPVGGFNRLREGR